MSAAIKLSSPATREFWEIPVLFEDAHLLALDKPAGLPTSPDHDSPERPNLMTLLHTGIAAGKPWARERGLSYLMNAHRLDLETSGVILFAKTKPMLLALADYFGIEKPGRKYLALVHGTPPEVRFEIDAKLAPHPTWPGKVCVDPNNGKRSQTLFEVIEKFSRNTLLRCETLTLREHQIRVHLGHAGLRLAGDELYGGKPLWLSRLKPDFRLKDGKTERPLISRPALHAEQLTLPHPVTGETLTITAPWPKDLTVAVKYLRRYAL
ncbi:MAG: pseudouridine synthase [Verrucomicrobiota bacterium]